VSDKNSIGGSGNYSDFDAIVRIMTDVSRRLPKGVRFKREKDRWLNFQITMPDGRRVVKASGCPLTDVGIYQALDKAHKIRHKIDTLASETELWEWYEKEILCKSQMVNDSTTYREIFEKLEARYWGRRNKNTSRQRSKDIPNDVATFDRYYGVVFERFPDWDKQPKWDEIKGVLFSWQQGSKSFKDAYAVVRNICQECPNSDKLLGLLGDIDAKQTEYAVKQSISLEEFLVWREKVISEADDRTIDSKRAWLWVMSACVVYGLRPTEIASAQNLTTPYKGRNVNLPALNDPTNKDLLLILGDKTYFGATTKTGGRVCRPLITDISVLEKLEIRQPEFPSYTPAPGSNAKSVVGGYSNQMRMRMQSWGCPVTQAYAFRHLANQLGEKYGIPQEIRARSLGHSTAVNDSVYKKRSNLQTTIDLLTNHSRQPLTLEIAIQRLQSLGIDTSDASVNVILRVIYQID
jgi:hypothetical protein